MKRMMNDHTGTKSNEEMPGPVVESDSNATNHNPQQPSELVVKRPSNMTRDTKRALADLGFVGQAYIEVLVENNMAKWSNTLQS